MRNQRHTFLTAWCTVLQISPMMDMLGNAIIKFALPSSSFIYFIHTHAHTHTLLILLLSLYLCLHKFAHRIGFPSSIFPPCTPSKNIFCISNFIKICLTENVKTTEQKCLIQSWLCWWWSAEETTSDFFLNYLLGHKFPLYEIDSHPPSHSLLFTVLAPTASQYSFLHPSKTPRGKGSWPYVGTLPPAMVFHR